MRVIVAYDVVDDGRRDRLFKRLRAFLEPVQRSVFEGELPTKHLPRLQRAIESRIDPEKDDVRIWLLCGGCAGSTLLLGRARRVRDPKDPIVV